LARIFDSSLSRGNPFEILIGNISLIIIFSLPQIKITIQKFLLLFFCLLLSFLIFFIFNRELTTADKTLTEYPYYYLEHLSGIAFYGLVINLIILSALIALQIYRRKSAKNSIKNNF
jgi:hypothetical protein